MYHCWSISVYVNIIIVIVVIIHVSSAMCHAYNVKTSPFFVLFGRPFVDRSMWTISLAEAWQEWEEKWPHSHLMPGRWFPELVTLGSLNWDNHEVRKF